MHTRRTGLTDTSLAAQEVLDEIHRHMPPEQKWRLFWESQRRGKLLVEAGRHFRGAGSATMTTAGNDALALRTVIAALDSLAIPYALGGSMASSLHGVMRTTQAADLTVEPFPGREQADRRYLYHWAGELAISDLLQQALEQDQA